MRASILIPAMLVAAAACTPHVPAAPVPLTDECTVVADTARARIDVGVVVPAERDGADLDVTGAQAYETLVRVDCTNSVIPGLAVGWSTSDGRTWRFDIRRGASFTDGTPANARTVAAALAMLPVFAGVAAAGEYDLRIALQRGADVRLFARRDLAVRRNAGASRPAGTGPYEPVFDTRNRVLQLITRDSSEAPYGTHRRAPDTISIRTFGRDLRAAIDVSVDALATNDAAAIEYARARSGYVIAPLTWSRTYVLATAAGEDRGDDVPATAFPAALVGAAARPALPPYWWSACVPPRDAGAADAAGAAGNDGTADRRILFLSHDPVARSIAERIAALARGRAPEWLAGRLPDDGASVAAGVDDAELVEAVRTRGALAIVSVLPRVEHGGCGVSTMEQYGPLLTGWHVTPLVDTRDDLVYRPGIGRVTVDADGTLRFGGR